MSNEDHPLIYITPAEVQDEAVLWLMLTYAASMGVGGAEQVATAQADPYLMTYVSGWGLKKSDVGVVARDAVGNALGAAWLRLGGGGGQFKLSDDDVPELATAVIPAARRRGVGTALMRRLITLATPHFRRIVLSVREVNPAVQFYFSLGFRTVSSMKNRVGGNSLVMALNLVPLRDFAIHPVANTEVSDTELERLLKDVYVGGGFTVAAAAETAFRASTVKARGEVLVALDLHGTLLGMVITVFPGSPACKFAKAGESELHLLCVRPSQQGRGVGGALVEASTTAARIAGAARMILWTQPSMQTAQSLYLKHGFARLPGSDFSLGERSFLMFARSL